MLGVATVLGVAGVIASFGLFYLGERVCHLAAIRWRLYVPETLRGRAPDHLRCTNARTVLVHPARASPVDGGDRDTSGSNGGRCLRVVHGPSSAGGGHPLLVLGYALAWVLVHDRVKLIA